MYTIMSVIQKDLCSDPVALFRCNMSLVCRYFVGSEGESCETIAPVEPARARDRRRLMVSWLAVTDVIERSRRRRVSWPYQEDFTLALLLS
jgi:hypothetical protein